ncbi:OmpA family protein [Litoreibacter janthinus]|uniref:OmpA family protein n=1 Tax=Litoreibacter janthinus TaxID=670154 RepID=A0A1I6HTI5_9RHOB|nr:OmpA family protein [Litoreibacter janthinus]SFR57560.1 OmpA family protein [Litoreibacter janthinus]
MFKSTSSIALIAAFTVGLSACSAPRDSFEREAGAELDEGGFGNPTMTNTLIANGSISVAETLGARFANDVNTQVNFEFNSSQLDANARAALLEQANWIRQFPEVRFRVYGHTDLVGSNAANKALGLRRAKAAVNFLTSQGISRSRLEAVASFGETRPVILTENPERRNRRTVTEVSGFVEGSPMLLNGKYGVLVLREYVQTAKSDETLARERIVQ